MQLNNYLQKLRDDGMISKITADSLWTFSRQWPKDFMVEYLRNSNLSDDEDDKDEEDDGRDEILKLEHKFIEEEMEEMGDALVKNFLNIFEGKEKE